MFSGWNTQQKKKLRLQIKTCLEGSCNPGPAQAPRACISTLRFSKGYNLVTPFFFFYMKPKSKQSNVAIWLVPIWPVLNKGTQTPLLSSDIQRSLCLRLENYPESTFVMKTILCPVCRWIFTLSLVAPELLPALPDINSTQWSRSVVLHSYAI